MTPFEIKSKLATIPSPVIMAHILCFDNWTDPDDFYTMSSKERRVLLNRYRSIAVEPTETNQWIWFGSYNTKNHPKFSSLSLPSYLYQIVIQPHNNARIRGLLNTTKSDVNPFKYFKALNMTTLELLKYKSNEANVPLSDVMTPKQNQAFEDKVQAALADVKEYYMENSPTAEADFMKATLLQAGHMPLAAEEAMARSQLPFK